MDERGDKMNGKLVPKIVATTIERRIYYESNIFNISNGGSGGYGGAQRACARFFIDDGHVHERAWGKMWTDDGKL